MATNTADPMEQDPNSCTATFERKRPHDVVARDDASNTGSALSTPRKRAKHAGKLGHQDVRDFVPAGASFSTSVVPVNDDAQDSGDDRSQAETSLKVEASSDHEVSQVSSTNDGLRLHVGNLSFKATVEDLRKFFGGFALENITIPTNSRTHRPVGYAFVTFSTSDEADRATSQLSGKEILERKVLIQRARAEETKAPDPGATAAEEAASATWSKRTEGCNGIGSVKADKDNEENNTLRESSESAPPQEVQAAPPLNWNAVNTTKIRTNLGGSVDKVKDEPRLVNGDRDLATSVALERVEGLRIRLSAMNPHDGPVSAYESAQQELHDAEVDYNYCLYFPLGETFQPPPLSTARMFPPKRKGSRERRLRIWSVIEQSMKDGTLQDLREGKIPVSSAEHMGQPSSAHRSAFESSDGLEQTDGQRGLQLSTITDPKQIQILDTQEAFRKQYGYLKAFPYMKPGTHSYEKMKKRIHEVGIHLNYCQYFPLTEDYLPLALAKKGLSELDSSNIDGTRASELRAAQIWKLVEQCTQDGNLQDLKDGGLAAWLKDAPPPHQSFLASALQAKHPQEFTEVRGRNVKPQPGSGLKKAGGGGTRAASASVKPNPKEEGHSPERYGTSESDGRVILNLDYGNQGMSTQIEGKDPQSTMNMGHRDEEMPSDVQNLDTKQGLPAMNGVDGDLYVSDSGAGSDSETESNESDMDSERQSEDNDAMVQYSDSKQITADEAERNKKTILVPPSHKARILADLSSNDLNAQLKYFHTTEAREEVDGNTPVRCLVCTKEGHLAGLCESLTCSTCGAFNQHTTQACPNKARCGRCREQGHDDGRCPYKLKRMFGVEMVCDLCQRNGHIEDDCELIWRTSGRPWESDLANAKVWFSCYECGHSGHLGNDCPSRKPNKPMGTSTWDGNLGRVRIKSTREIKIKGKATRQDPINFDDSDDDRANFYRPKISVPEPVRKGQIRIVTGRRESPVYEAPRNERQVYSDHRHGSFAPVNGFDRNGEARQSYQQYGNGGRDNWRAVDGPEYPTGHDDLRYNSYRPSERRSRSPPYRDREGHGSGSSWLAPRIETQDRHSRGDTNVYRPMPSAAHNAWTRRRV